MIALVELPTGRKLAPVVGFRDSVLRARPSGTPSDQWSTEDYIERARRRVADAQRRGRQIADAAEGTSLSRGLEIGCGGGLDCVLAALDGIEQVVGVDNDSPLFSADRRGPALRLIGAAAEITGRREDGESLLNRLAVEIRPMDACALGLPDESFDVVWSRTALEHIQPLESVLVETARVLRPGGIAHHVIDPFFWLKGCHARGLTELPWAHARLDLEDYEHFVRVAESRRRSVRRTAWMRSLNALSVDAWRSLFESHPAFEVLDWDEHPSPLAEELLDRYPEVLEDALPGLTVRDLTCSAITIVLRRTDQPAGR